MKSTVPRICLSEIRMNLCVVLVPGVEHWVPVRASWVSCAWTPLGSPGTPGCLHSRAWPPPAPQESYDKSNPQRNRGNAGRCNNCWRPIDHQTNKHSTLPLARLPGKLSLPKMKGQMKLNVTTVIILLLWRGHRKPSLYLSLPVDEGWSLDQNTLESHHWEAR